MFTKQHFIALAKLLKETDATTKQQLALDLAKLFSEDNSKFDSKRFYKACGIIQGSA
jgi:hypothetical protein